MVNVVMVYFKVFSQHQHGETEQNHKKTSVSIDKNPDPAELQTRYLPYKPRA